MNNQFAVTGVVSNIQKFKNKTGDKEKIIVSLESRVEKGVFQTVYVSLKATNSNEIFKSIKENDYVGIIGYMESIGMGVSPQQEYLVPQMVFELCATGITKLVENEKH